MKSLVLQDIVLNQIRRDRSEVVVTLCTGEKFDAKVRGFDSFTIIFDLENKSQLMAYKHSIASICIKEAVLTDEKQGKHDNL